MLAMLSSGAAEATETPLHVAVPMQTTQHGRRRLAKPAGLVSRKDFLRVQGSGQRFKGRLMLLVVAPSAAEGAPRVGYTVSRKVGNAVKRNHVRRRLRETVRCTPDLLSIGFDHVIIAFPTSATASFSALQQEALCLLKKAHGWASRQACLLP